MADVASILAELKKKGTEKTRATYARHGMPPDRVYGVSMADLKVIAKTIRGEQALACELYDTGYMDAMYLAGMVADGSQMTVKQLDAWAAGTKDLRMIAEYTVPWVAVENAKGRELAVKWIKAKAPHVATCGWCTYSGLVAMKADAELDLNEIEELLSRVVKEIGGAENRVRYTMNGFVISVGYYVKPLFKQTLTAARAMGVVLVDMGDTACEVRSAEAEIKKAEAAGRIGKKRKMIRC